MRSGGAVLMKIDIFDRARTFGRGTVRRKKKMLVSVRLGKVRLDQVKLG